MTAANNKATPSPIDLVAAYVEGAPPESGQFGFLIGEWDAQTTRYAKDGSIQVQYDGRRRAEHINDGRIVKDDFTAYMPDGTEIGYFMTLRTYSPFTEQWEMTFLTALQPQLVTSFTGKQVGDEMHLIAKGTRPNGRPVLAKVRFHSISPDSFDWEQMTSTDDGETWRRESTITAKRCS